MSIDYCATHHVRWDRDWHTECPSCAARRSFESDLQDVSELAWDGMNEVNAGTWVRRDANAHLWDEAEALTAKLVTALQKLKTHFDQPDDDGEPFDAGSERPIMGVRAGSGQML